jgi:hypothetical protein
MADNTTVHIGENSPEQIAFKLLERISSVEKLSLHSTNSGQAADRKWILSTYFECLQVVRGYAPE